jgi:hypothetical protein
MSHLARLGARLDALSTEHRFPPVRVPGAWVDPEHSSAEIVTVDPIEWWIDVLKRIPDRREQVPVPHCAWTRGAAIYNLIVRTATAFDHDGDGIIGGGEGPRESGTFVKAIALLPYIRSLGCNVVHLLPIAAIGADGRKGALGSPYATRDPYRLDEALAEPIVGLGADVEFGAFVEAAHRLGLRVAVEFALRTAAKDSDWIAEHPEWFYWVREDAPFASPLFRPETLRELKERVDSGLRTELPVPPASYRALFVPPATLADVSWDGERWIGRTAEGVRARIPGAFSDWPPDDVQPPWGDVTYLRMYDHPDFDYMAYNTLRMYDARLARPEHAVESLWGCIVGVIPHYQRRFGIDGALIDMGHALPDELKARVIREARGVDPGFAFWGEDFAPSDARKEEGYDAVTGNYWWSAHRPAAFRDSLLCRLSERGAPIPFFAAPETHNTPRSAARSGGTARSELVWTLGCFLPAVPFLHAGFELGEVEPVNTGLDFSAEEIDRYPPERLGLYNAIPLRWGGDNGLLPAVRRALTVRAAHLETIADPSPGALCLADCGDERAVCFLRLGTREGILVVGLFGGVKPARISLEVPFPDGPIVDPIRGTRYAVSGGCIDLDLTPWMCVVAVGRLAPGAASAEQSHRVAAHRRRS